MKKHRKVEARKRVSELHTQTSLNSQDGTQHGTLHLHLEALEKEFSMYILHTNTTDTQLRELAAS